MPGSFSGLLLSIPAPWTYYRSLRFTTAVRLFVAISGALQQLSSSNAITRPLYSCFYHMSITTISLDDNEDGLNAPKRRSNVQR